MTDPSRFREANVLRRRFNLKAQRVQATTEKMLTADAQARELHLWQPVSS
jgi:hypothetical protein